MGINENGLRSITFIVALAVIAFVLKSQYSSVIERRFDIGILKAIGWSDGRVVSQLLGESLIQAGGGGLMGLLAAIGIIFWVPIDSVTGIDAIAGVGVSELAVALGFGLALAGGLVAGILPGLAAVRMRPADILRRL
jgi:putative ABC transport system permease protein